MSEDKLLEIQDLRVSTGSAEAVRGISLTLEPGERLGIVGESGSGKSLSALAVMGLLPPGLHAHGQVAFQGRHLLSLSDRAMSRLRGADIAMIFQDPLTALNPTRRVGEQLADLVQRHRHLGRSEARQRAVAMIERLGLPRPAVTARAYPHQLSGGQRQRIMIGMAVICQPSLIIADEPTTALDATVQRRILELLDDVVTETGAALILITHDLPVVATMCDRLAVMYAGCLAETGGLRDVLDKPKHPYTRGLLGSQIKPADLDGQARRLPSIPGAVPALNAMPAGCAFAPRCEFSDSRCEQRPELDDTAHAAACWHPDGVKEETPA